MSRMFYTPYFSGKFAFGLQDSADPEIVYGMRIDEEAEKEDFDTSVDYYLEDTKENRLYIKSVLDEQYDILGIDKSVRIYHVENQQGIRDFYTKHILGVKFFDDGTGYLKNYNSDQLLAWYRIELGIIINSEIYLNEECWLNAEY